MRSALALLLMLLVLLGKNPCLRVTSERPLGGTHSRERQLERLMFWFCEKKLVGSNFFLSAVRRA